MAGLRDGVVIAVLSLTASAWASAQEEQPVPADPLADLIVAVEKDQAEDDIAPDEGNGASEADQYLRNKNEVDGETTETEAVAEDFATPPLWKVSDDDSDVYLLGTFHILPADLKWRNATITEIIKSADTFYFEVEGDAPSAQMRTTHILMTEGFNPPGEMLTDYLSDEDDALLEAIAREVQIPFAMINPMRPWQAFLTLSVQFIVGQGFEPGKGADTVLMNEARVLGRELIYFETLEEQLGFFTGLDHETELDLLKITIGDWENQKEGFTALFDAWRSGDIEAIDTNMNDTMRETAPEVFDILIEKRNKAWADKITADMKDGAGIAVVAVGAAHLAGGKIALPRLLKKRGFEVERVEQVNAAPPPVEKAETSDDEPADVPTDIDEKDEAENGED